MRKSLQTVFLGLLALWVLASPSLAREAQVVMNDGRVFKGEFVDQDANTVFLVIKEIRTPLPRADIREITYLKTPEEEYRERKAAIDPADVKKRYELAFDLFQREAYELAKAELLELRQQFPDDDKTRMLLEIVEERLSKKSQAQPGSTSASTGVKPPKPGTGAKPDPKHPSGGKPRAEDVILPTQHLTDADVNAVRVWEIEFAAKPTVMVPADVLEEFFNKYRQFDGVPKGRTEQTAFRKLPGYRQLEQIMKLSGEGTREYYPRVTVKDDPPALKEFRVNIHPKYVLSFCATNECHGGKNAGSFFLFRANSNSDAVVYTNFYILASTRGSQGMLIDRSRPEESLLLQYGLDPKQARFPHPEVHGVNWRFRLQGPKDPMYLSMKKWMGEQLFKPMPAYGIEYELPSVKTVDDLVNESKAKETAPAPTTPPAPGPAKPAASPAAPAASTPAVAPPAATPSAPAGMAKPAPKPAP